MIHISSSTVVPESDRSHPDVTSRMKHELTIEDGKKPNSGDLGRKIDVNELRRNKQQHRASKHHGISSRRRRGDCRRHLAFGIDEATQNPLDSCIIQVSSCTNSTKRSVEQADKAPDCRKKGLRKEESSKYCVNKVRITPRE